MAGGGDLQLALARSLERMTALTIRYTRVRWRILRASVLGVLDLAVHYKILTRLGGESFQHFLVYFDWP